MNAKIEESKRVRGTDVRQDEEEEKARKKERKGEAARANTVQIEMQGRMGLGRKKKGIKD